MSLAKFFVEQQKITVGDCLVLSSQESYHAVKVRRLKQGDKLLLLNGSGTMAFAFIEQCDSSGLVTCVESVKQIEASKRVIRIAVALPKGDRQKQMLEMLAQLGVTSIVPLLCEFSVSQYSEKVMQRWRRALLEACKQSENPFLPQLFDAQTVLSFVDTERELSKTAQHLVFYADINGVLPSSLKLDETNQHISIAIGPEGGFSKDEVSILEKNGITKLKLSNHILRIETAAAVAAAAFV